MLHNILAIVVLLCLLPFIILGGILGALFTTIYVAPSGGWVAYADMIARGMTGRIER